MTGLQANCAEMCADDDLRSRGDRPARRYASRYGCRRRSKGLPLMSITTWPWRQATFCLHRSQACRRWKLYQLWQRQDRSEGTIMSLLPKWTNDSPTGVGLTTGGDMIAGETVGTFFAPHIGRDHEQDVFIMKFPAAAGITPDTIPWSDSFWVQQASTYIDDDWRCPQRRLLRCQVVGKVLSCNDEGWSRSDDALVMTFTSRHGERRSAPMESPGDGQHVALLRTNLRFVHDLS